MSNLQKPPPLLLSSPKKDDGTPLSGSRRSLITIKKNGEVQQTDEYNAIDMLNTHYGLLSPTNADIHTIKLDQEIGEGCESPGTHMINDDYMFGESQLNLEAAERQVTKAIETG